MTDQQISQGVGPTPSAITVQGSQTLLPKLAFAAFDGSGAAGNFLPVVKFIGPGGQLAGQAVGDEVTAGASVDQTWFRGLAKPAAANIVQIFNETLTAPGRWRLNNILLPEFAWVEVHIAAKLATGTYGVGPGQIRVCPANDPLTAHRWRIRAAGSTTNVSASGADGSICVGFAPQLANTAVLQAIYGYSVARFYNWQSQVSYKSCLFEGYTLDQATTIPNAADFVNQWTGAGEREETPWPSVFGSTGLSVYPNANPTTTAGAPDAGLFATGSRLTILGYKGA